jgi:hypothetical protein
MLYFFSVGGWSFRWFVVFFGRRFGGMVVLYFSLVVIFLGFVVCCIFFRLAVGRFGGL